LREWIGDRFVAKNEGVIPESNDPNLADRKRNMEELYSRVRFRNILYATDFSLQSQAALRYAVSLARKYESQIFLMHVVSADLDPTLSSVQALKASEAEDNAAVQSMLKLEPQLEGIPHEFVVRKGDVWAEALKLIEAKAITLLVMGTHGRSGATKVVMGSVAEEIFRRAPCPVLTVGPNVCGEPDMLSDIRTILCPVDFRPESLAAVPYAVSLAEQNQARLYLLHIAGGNLDELPEASLKAALRALVPSGAELWCEPKAFVEYGVPAQKILESAEELGVDVIVLGVKAAATLASKSPHLAMATAYKIVTESICPVLTVRGRPTK
jgi:nucleotide-binding universal stress UspA family protein